MHRLSEDLWYILNEKLEGLDPRGKLKGLKEGEGLTAYQKFCSSGLRHSADPQKESERSTIVEVIYWPSAHPATVPGWWVRGLLSVRWDLVVGLSGASWSKF